MLIPERKTARGVQRNAQSLAVEDIDVVERLTLPETTLKELMDRTAFAMAHQDVRYYLNGLLLDLRDGALRCVATDGHRLALCETAANVEIQSKRQIIIPRKGVIELQRLLDSDGHGELANIARERLARLLLAEGKHDEAHKLLEAVPVVAGEGASAELRGERALGSTDAVAVGVAGYHVINTYLSISPPDGGWSLNFWANNITDELYVTARGAANDFFNADLVGFGLPRTFGATVRVKFGAY